MQGGWPQSTMPFEPDYEQFSDEELLNILQTGTREQKKNAFSAIYEKYYKEVWQIIVSRGNRYRWFEEENKDVFGTVWLEAFRKFSTDFEWRNIPLGNWLLKTAKTMCQAQIKEIYSTGEGIQKLKIEAQSDLDEYTYRFSKNGQCIQSVRDELREEKAELARRWEAWEYLQNVLENEVQQSQEIPSEVHTEATRLLHKALIQLKERDKNIVWASAKGKKSPEIARDLKIKSNNAVRVALSRALKKLRDLPEIIELGEKVRRR